MSQVQGLEPLHGLLAFSFDIFPVCAAVKHPYRGRLWQTEFNDAPTGGPGEVGKIE
jgi:hypothetical protein